VSTRVVSVNEGLDLVESLKNTNLKIIGIAGPGDPFSEPEKLFSFIENVRRKYGSNYEICLSSNGLAVHRHISILKELKVNFMTLTINALRPETYAEIVEWIIDHGTLYRGIEAGARLLSAQFKSLEAICQAGIRCKINTVIVPDINQYEILDLFKVVKKIGATKGNLIPLIPVSGTRFGDIHTVSIKEHEMLTNEAESVLSQVRHCKKCRADAQHVRPLRQTACV